MQVITREPEGFGDLPSSVLHTAWAPHLHPTHPSIFEAIPASFEAAPSICPSHSLKIALCGLHGPSKHTSIDSGELPSIRLTVPVVSVHNLPRIHNSICSWPRCTTLSTSTISLPEHYLYVVVAGHISSLPRPFTSDPPSCTPPGMPHWSCTTGHFQGEGLTSKIQPC